jgi:cytochrome c553
MKRNMILVSGLILFGIASVSYAAGDAAAGKTKAAACVACHGANGEGKAPNPPLAGKSEAEIAQALQDYKSGKRTNASMKMFAGKLSDADIADLAAYYTSLKK